MKFLHTADWQLGKPYARIADDDKKAKVRAARIEAVKRIGELAKSEKAEFVLVAGDLFDSPTPEKSTVSAACSAIGKIGVPVLAIPGNHDHGGPGGLWEQDFFRQEAESLAPNFRILLEREPVELDGAFVLPCPLLRRHETEDPTAWLREMPFESENPRIVLAHGGVHGFDSESDGTPNLIALDRLPAGEIDYVALGDWHGTKEIAGDAWYSGTPEIDRFPKGVNDPGNVLVVEVKRGSAPKVEKITTGGLGWHNLTFDFASDDDISPFEDALAEKLGNRAGEDLLLLELTGSLGFTAAARLDGILATLDARLLRVKLRNAVRLAPTEEETAALAHRAGDPLVSRVASSLLEESGGSGENAETARIALRELHAACSD